jgi:hypothetical protein
MSGKGGDFEREVSKMLTVWLTGKKKPYAFWRMPGSGSLMTIHEENIGLSGDIRAVSPEAEFFTDIFSVECKTGYPKTSFWQHFKDIKNFNIKDFWKQCCEDADKAAKLPMLIYRKKGTKPIVGVCSKTTNFLYEKLTNFNFIGVVFSDEIRPIYFFNMEKFFDTVKPDDIRKFSYGKDKC